MAENADWQNYFDGIKNVCPWSYAAWRRGKIAITNWGDIIAPLGSLEARLYLTDSHNPRQLKKICQRLNTHRSLEEWLYSHPRFGLNSTPQACFIQQSRERLFQARNNLKSTAI